MTSPELWVDRPVLVTGATGFLGGWLLRDLVEAGASVVCLVRDWVPRSMMVQDRLVERVNVVRGDVRDQALLERVLGEYEVRTVFHLAAQTIVGIANRNPVSTFETNVGGTWALLEACRRSPTVEGIVTASSDKAYGEHDDLPYDEGTPLRARHPYDVSKACADRICRTYAATYDSPVVVTRCGNFFGGGDLNWNRLVPGTIRSVLRGQRPVIRSDGTMTRDYLYVEDGASAYIHCAAQLAEEPDLRGEAFNFSTGTPLSVLELVEKILDVTGSDLKPDVRDEAPHEIAHQYLDATKAREVLGWEPRFTVDEALGRTVEWYQGFLGGSG